MNSWCESCARKNLCYVVDDRPKCFVPITNTASGTPYLVGISSISRDNHEIAKDEPQTDCTEALTLLWIKNMVTDEEFYRIDARLKCISCKWWNDTVVGGSECVSKECTYQPKDEHRRKGVSR